MMVRIIEMEYKDIFNIIAIVFAPIAASVIAVWLQNRSEKRKDKMYIFKVLMTSRVYGWTPEKVNVLNIIDIVFSDDKKVRAAWKDLSNKYNVENPEQLHLKKIEQAQYKLIEEIANSLGYKNTITWEEIQNPYVPRGMIEQIENQKNMQQVYAETICGVNRIVKRQEQNGERGDIE